MSSYHFMPHQQQKAMLGKEEVVAWFRLLNGSQRIETLCALLDCCVPFEVRFIGSFIEDLGRRDFHELRDVENKANHFTQSNKSLEANKLALYNSLAAEPGQLTLNTNPINPVNNVNNTGSHQSILLSSAFTTSQDTRNHRPNSSHNPDGKPRGPWSFENPQLQAAQSKSTNSKVLAPIVNGSCIPNKTANNTSSNCKAEDENEDDRNSPQAGGDLMVVSEDRTRQRMILYLALLTATNREAASAFYALMSQVEQTVGAPGWLEGLEEIVLEEVALLYTLGAHHPAFSFEQRIMLSEILSQVRSQLYKHKVSRSYPYYPALQYDPKYATPAHYYVQYIPQPNMSQVQPQMTSSATQAQAPTLQHTSQAVAGANVVSLPQTVDTSRIQPQVQVQPQQMYYHPYQTVYVQGQHQHHPQIMTNPGPARMMPVTPMSPRAVGIPVPNSVGPGPDQYRPPLKPEGVPNPVNDIEALSPGLNEVNVVLQHPRRISCFNCGESTHAGIDCPVPRMEEITQSLYRVKFNAPNPKETTDSSS